MRPIYLHEINDPYFRHRKEIPLQERFRIDEERRLKNQEETLVQMQKDKEYWEDRYYIEHAKLAEGQV